MKNVDRMGLIIITSHLIITLVVIIGYIICVVRGISAPQLETMAFMIMAYWFGAMGANKINKSMENKQEDDTK
jgi:type III secretory pathway component EscS